MLNRQWHHPWSLDPLNKIRIPCCFPQGLSFYYPKAPSFSDDDIRWMWHWWYRCNLLGWCFVKLSHLLLWATPLHGGRDSFGGGNTEDLSELQIFGSSQQKHMPGISKWDMYFWNDAPVVRRQRENHRQCPRCRMTLISSLQQIKLTWCFLPMIWEVCAAGYTRPTVSFRNSMSFVTMYVQASMLFLEWYIEQTVVEQGEGPFSSEHGTTDLAWPRKKMRYCVWLQEILEGKVEFSFFLFVEQNRKAINMQKFSISLIFLVYHPLRTILLIQWNCKTWFVGVW
jgi:hypothetical protein